MSKQLTEEKTMRNETIKEMVFSMIHGLTATIAILGGIAFLAYGLAIGDRSWNLYAITLPMVAFGAFLLYVMYKQR